MKLVLGMSKRPAGDCSQLQFPGWKDFTGETPTVSAIYRKAQILSPILLSNFLPSGKTYQGASCEEKNVAFRVLVLAIQSKVQQTAMKYHLTLVIPVNVKKTRTNKCW